MMILNLILFLSFGQVFAQGNSNEKMDWNTWLHQQKQLENQFSNLSNEVKQKQADEKVHRLIGAAEEVQTNLNQRIMLLQEKITSLENDCQDPKKKIPRPSSLLKFTQLSNVIKADKAPDPKTLDLIAVSQTIQKNQNNYMNEQRDRIDDLSVGCAQIANMGAGKPTKKVKYKTKLKSVVK